MINKLYDFRDVAIPDALLNASVSREEIDGELRLTAQRFTTIAPAFDGICNGDIVVLEIPDEQDPDGVQQVFVNMGRGFFDSEEALLGLCAGAQTEVFYENQTVPAAILAVKRKYIPELTNESVCQLEIQDLLQYVDDAKLIRHENINHIPAHLLYNQGLHSEAQWNPSNRKTLLLPVNIISQKLQFLCFLCNLVLCNC